MRAEKIPTPRTDALSLETQSGRYPLATNLGNLCRELERENAIKDAYIARLLNAGNSMADVSTERRRLIWREAVLSGLPNASGETRGPNT